MVNSEDIKKLEGLLLKHSTFIFLLLFLVFMNFVFFSTWQNKLFYPELFFIFTLLFVSENMEISNFGTFFLVGLLNDFVEMTPFGVHALSFLLAGFCFILGFRLYPFFNKAKQLLSLDIIFTIYFGSLLGLLKIFHCQLTFNLLTYFVLNLCLLFFSYIFYSLWRKFV